MARNSTAQECQKEALGVMFQEAINAFYQCFGQAGPYNLSNCHKLPWQMKVFCSWPGSSGITANRRWLFVCDKAAYSRLEAAVRTISVVASGVAFPHVHLASEVLCIEWFLVNSSSEESGDVSEISSDLVWFVVDEVVRDLFELFASWRGLAPVRSVAGISFQTDIASPTQLQEMSLTVMAVGFCNLFVTWMSPEDSKCMPKSFSPTSSVTLKSRFADGKGLTDLRCTEGLSTFVELDYHMVMHGVPQYFLWALNQCLQRSGQQEEKKSVGCDGSEITVKEEPLQDIWVDIGDKKPPVCKDTMSLQPFLQGQRRKLRGKSLGKTHGNRIHVRQANHQISEHFGRLLRCPKCCASFKLGFQGQGVGYLMRHVYDSHQRLTSHCRLRIREQYGDILQALERKSTVHCQEPQSTL